MEAGLHVARFAKKNWIHKFDFQKILKKIMVVDNTMIYHYENFQPQIRNILIYAKKEKSVKISNFSDCALFTESDMRIFSFLLRTEYKEFLIENFHSDRSMYYLQLWFFSEFFDTKICRFNFFWKTGLHVARPPFRLSGLTTLI